MRSRSCWKTPRIWTLARVVMSKKPAPMADTAARQSSWACETRPPGNRTRSKRPSFAVAG
jgi:hypothetical protein